MKAYHLTITPLGRAERWTFQKVALRVRVQMLFETSNILKHPTFG